jgi:excisionase family DNA binding protein
MNTETTPKVISVKAYAEMFDISRQYAYDLIKQNKIKSIKIGSAIRIPYSEVHKLESMPNE